MHDSYFQFGIENFFHYKYFIFDISSYQVHPSNTLNDENSSEDEDTKPEESEEVQSDTSKRRGLRKRRLITKRHKSYLELRLDKSRGRGRPPIHCPPSACEECGKSFTLLKHYKRHCVSN